MSDYLLILSAGFLGSAHCMAMCGGLVIAYNMKYGGGVYFSLIYNSGRILSYSIIGFTMGLLGSAFISAGILGKFQSLLPLAAGILMILIGVDMLGILPKKLRWFTSNLYPKTLSDMLIGSRLKKGNPAPFLLGILNGFFPCGLIYAIGMKAAAEADPLKGTIMMAVFGIGTLPALLSINLFAGFVGRMQSEMLSAISSALIIILGVKLMLSV